MRTLPEIMRIQPVVVMILSFLAIAAPGAAQDSAETDAEHVNVLARTHFDRGVEHYSEGNYEAALAEFQRSHELLPTYKLLFNLAQVQIERRDYAAAFELFTDYLRSGGPAIAPERASAVEQELARLKQRIAELDLDVDVQGAQIFVNAVPVGTSPLAEPVRVNVGSIFVRVEKAGHSTFEQRLSVAGTDKRRLTVMLQPLTAPSPPQPPVRLALAPSRELNTTPNMTPCWISLGAALVLGGATATFGALTLSAHQHQDQQLARYPGRPNELDAARGRLQTFAALTDVFAAASLTAGIVGLYFLWSPPERPADRAKLRLTATPAGVTLGGAF
jgi:tetratricopeptide (TPR) repeat protein